jgi:hypothetical protein
MTIKSTETEYMWELARTQGVACSTVSDGHVIILSKQTLMNLLARASESKEGACVLFIKRPDMKVTN